jgi:hypothetical protein
MAVFCQKNLSRKKGILPKKAGPILAHPLRAEEFRLPLFLATAFLSQS